MEVQQMGTGAIAEGMVQHIFRILLENNSTSPTYPSNTISKFNPSMAIIIIVLISAFLFLGFFSLYVRRCAHITESDRANAADQARTGAAGGRASQGLDKTVVEALPLVGFSLVKGFKGGKDLVECAVCLSDFEEDENLRLLPKCGHVFHPDCIDMWFHSQSTCPLCRASLVPAEGKEAEGEDFFSEELQNWVSSRGTGPHGETFTIHDGPPVPPNGSILELLSQDGADRILAESLRLTDRLDAGLARREGEDENPERAARMRALNRALSNNSASFQKASRGFEASGSMDVLYTGSARLNSSSVAIVIDGIDSPAAAGRENSGSSQSFNTALRRSSSVGSSGRYIRQLLGLNYETFSPGSGQDGTRLLGSDQSLPKPLARRDRSANELRNMEIPTWDDVDLYGENVVNSPYAVGTNMPGVLPIERWLSRGRKLYSQELTVPKRMAQNGEPLYTPRKEKDKEGNLIGSTRSDRWSFGQSFRTTFSFRRTSSNASDVESSSQQSNNLPGPSAAKPKKYSPWSGAMNFRRSTSSRADSVPSPHSPHSPSSILFPESFPLDTAAQSPPLDSIPQSLAVFSGQQRQSQHQQQQQPPPDDQLHIETQS